MTDPKLLAADAVIGLDAKHCLILAAHPDERVLPNGLPSPTRRTLVLQHDGRMARTLMVLPEPLVRSWTSSRGVGYAAPVKGSYLYTLEGGQWRRDTFAGVEESILGLWGFSGQGGSPDVLCLATESGLYMNRGQGWQLHASPEPARAIHALHGLTPDDIYVCFDKGLYRWDGQRFEPLDNPPGSYPTSVWVTPEAVWCAGSVLARWTAGEGWTEQGAAFEDVMALCGTGSQLVVGTFESGIFELGDGGQFRATTAPLKCLSLQALGGDMFARDKRAGLLRIDGQWQAINMPLCVAGQMPLDAA